MKSSLALLAISVMTAFAAPQVRPRQNDVPECEDGGDAEHLETYSSPAECLDACFLRENADNDNKWGVCRGQCKAKSHMSFEVVCHGS